MAAFNEADIFDDDGGLGEELAFMTADDIIRRSRLLDNEIRVLKVCCLLNASVETVDSLPHHELWGRYAQSLRMASVRNLHALMP